MKSAVVNALIILACWIFGLDAFAPPSHTSARRARRSSFHHLQDSLSSAEAASSATAAPPSASTTDKDAPSTQSFYAEAASPFSDFDYNAHWYPVSWAQDLKLNEPTKVTIFDVDYVVAKTSDTEVIAMLDQCPHKHAALSEGRVTSSGNFQCAYHGWSFNGTTGDCVEIPQVVQPDGTMPPKVPSRSCGTAVPAQIQQEMVWLFPGGGLEEALLASPPPTIEEYETKGWQLSQTVRDMPVDWPILISNIGDADHGLFAHQATAFDLYTASKEYPMQMQEEFPDNGKGWVLKTQVEANEKLRKIDRELRNDKPNKKRPQNITAATYFQAPCYRLMRRFDANNETNFVAIFLVCPVGVGRARFFGGGCSKKAPKRWLTNLFINNFLDQDTYLLATQQTNVLPKEAEEIRELMAKTKRPRALPRMKLSTRRKLFCYASPTEKADMRLEQFWDATLMRVPNRMDRLLQLDAAGAFSETPPRSVVLDRKSQFLDISPMAQDVVRNCQRISKAATVFSAAAVLAKVLTVSWSKASEYDKFLKPSVLTGLLGVSSVARWIAKKIIRESYFKYSEEYHQKDMNKIPSVWLDK